MSEHTMHLLVERGPDQGRRIQIPAAGARVGRSSENDISLNDPSISRFQCRFFFRGGRDLCIADLASTNETLVNDRPVTEVQLFEGDRVTIGESVMRVICDVLESRAEAGAPRAASTTGDASPGAHAGSVDAPAPVPASPPPPAARPVDLGLGEPGIPEVPARAPFSPRIAAGSKSRLILAGAVAVGAVGLFGLAAAVALRRPSLPPANVREILEIRYEKIEATPSNIFWYELTLQDGVIRARFQDLANERQGLGERKLAPAQLEELQRTVSDNEFQALNREYEGVSPDHHYSKRIQVVIGNRTREVSVLNRPEPEAFQRVRERLETFAQNELGLESIAQSREKLLESAQVAFLNARKLYDEREVRRGNLARTLRELRRLEILVQTIEPKPDYYEDAVAMTAEAQRMFDDRYRDGMFQADQAIRLRDWETANRHLLELQEMLDDRSDPRSDEVYKKLVDVQRRIRPR